MATVTPGYTFSSNEVVTPTKLNQAASPTVSNIVTADIVDGAVTQSKLNASVTLVPTGAVMPFAMNAAPSGWLAANGGEYLKTGTYAALFAAIGTTYGETNGSGGTGSSHFRVPDLRGYFVRGSGTNSDGTAAGTFGAKQADATKRPSTALTGTTNTTGAHTHTVTTNTGTSQPNEGGDAGGGYQGHVTSTTSSAGNHSHTVTINGGGDTETRPANIALLYCIKF
jgi:microcystin-dependent protein